MDLLGDTMEIRFLGVGEACDGNQPNTSILLKTDAHETAGRILLDCGFSVPHQYLSLDPLPEELETLWISHFHGDHFLGAPLLLLWFWEMNRTKPLNIIGLPGIKVKIEQAMELAYPNFMSRLGYPLLFQELTPEKNLQISDSIWKTAYSEHSQPCLSLRLELNGKSIFYSGDGRPTPMTRSLAAGCDIIIHEAYDFEDSGSGHGSISTCLDFARNSGAKRLALVHMQRNVRIQCADVIANFQRELADIEIMIPEKGSTISV
jgi:ribonuclease BN (tRNA processing enzyme)